MAGVTSMFLPRILIYNCRLQIVIVFDMRRAISWATAPQQSIAECSYSLQ